MPFATGGADDDKRGAAPLPACYNRGAMTTRRLLGLLASSVFALAGCPGFGDKDATTLLPPTYAESVGPLLASEEARCTRCHGGEERVRDDFRLDRCDDADGVLGARSMRAQVARVVESDEMPQDGDALSSASKTLLRAWADAGGDCRPNFEEHVRPLFERYCLDCHGASAPRDATTPETLRLDLCADDAQDGRLNAWQAYELIELYVFEERTAPMPPADEPQPTADERQRLQLWLDDVRHADEEGGSVPCTGDEGAAG